MAFLGKDISEAQSSLGRVCAIFLALFKPEYSWLKVCTYFKLISPHGTEN